MAADAYLPVWVDDLPAEFVFQPGGLMRMRLKCAAKVGVVKRVIAGPERCHVLVDIKRPYCRPSVEDAQALIGGLQA